jgi:hypothetical protein
MLEFEQNRQLMPEVHRIFSLYRTTSGIMSCSSFKDVAVPDIFVAASPRAGGHGERHRGKLELHDNRCHFLRVHSDSIFPTRFIRLGWPSRPSVRGRAVIV